MKGRNNPNSGLLAFHSLIDDDVGHNDETFSDKSIRLNLLQYRLNSDYYDYTQDKYVKLFDDIHIDLSDKSSYTTEIIKKHLSNYGYFTGNIKIDPIVGSISLNDSVHIHLPRRLPLWFTKKTVLWILSLGLSLKYGIVSSRFIRKQINNYVNQYSSSNELNVSFSKIENKYVLFNVNIINFDITPRFNIFNLFKRKNKHGS
jgi:hypothetical protein